MPDRRKRAHPDPVRIAALSIAMALHVVALLALLLPAASLRPVPREAEALTVDAIFRPAVAPPNAPAPAPAPDPIAQPAMVQRAPAPGLQAPQAAAPGTPTGNAGMDDVAPWIYDPDAGVTLVVYGSRPELQLETPDRPPGELPVYRRSFDPGTIDGLASQGAGGSVTFDVLVEPDGHPSALVITRQSASERALEAAMSVVGQWKFVPAMKDGAYVQGWLEVSLEF